MIDPMVLPCTSKSGLDLRAMERAGLSHYRFLQELAALPFVDALWLFGSRARGDFQARSDIDVAVAAPQASAGDWLRILDTLDEADTLLSVDCVRLDALAAQDPLRQRIEQDGELLYRRASDGH